MRLIADGNKKLYEKKCKITLEYHVEKEKVCVIIS